MHLVLLRYMNHTQIILKCIQDTFQSNLTSFFENTHRNRGDGQRRVITTYQSSQVKNCCLNQDSWSGATSRFTLTLALFHGACHLAKMTSEKQTKATLRQNSSKATKFSFQVNSGKSLSIPAFNCRMEQATLGAFTWTINTQIRCFLIKNT